MDTKNILDKAFNAGLSGASAMSINVMSLMWMRTTINYQYRHGSTMTNAFTNLYKQGGIPRFYKGLLPALVQGPMSRFGDTASNMVVKEIFTGSELPVSLQTLFASSLASSYRLAVMPVDTLKTIMQVEGNNGMSFLKNKIKKSGPSVLWHGGIGTSVATFVGHYPWFYTYNKLNEMLPIYNKDECVYKYIARNGFIGFTSTMVSDTTSNSIRVLKTYKQTTNLSYPNALQEIVKNHGVKSLLFRGLTTKLLSNGIQGFTFTILWQYIQDIMNDNKD